MIFLYCLEQKVRWTLNNLHLKLVMCVYHFGFGWLLFEYIIFCCDKVITFTISIILSVQFCDIKYVHIAVQSAPPSVGKTF